MKASLKSIHISSRIRAYRDSYIETIDGDTENKGHRYYIEQIHGMRLYEVTTLYVDYMHILGFENSALAEALVDQYYRYVKTESICTLYALYMRCICVIYAVYMHYMYSISTYNTMYTVYTLYMYSMCCIYAVYTIYTVYIVYTVHQ